MQISKAFEVRDLAQEIVRLIDAAIARAYRDRDAANERRSGLGAKPLTSAIEISYSPEASALRRRSMDLTLALAEMRELRDSSGVGVTPIHRTRHQQGEPVSDLRIDNHGQLWLGDIAEYLYTPEESVVDTKDVIRLYAFLAKQNNIYVDKYSGAHVFKTSDGAISLSVNASGEWSYTSYDNLNGAEQYPNKLLRDAEEAGVLQSLTPYINDGEIWKFRVLAVSGFNAYVGIVSNDSLNVVDSSQSFKTNQVTLVKMLRDQTGKWVGEE